MNSCFQSMMPVGEEGDVFFGEIEICCEVILELVVKGP